MLLSSGNQLHLAKMSTSANLQNLQITLRNLFIHCVQSATTSLIHRITRNIIVLQNIQRKIIFISLCNCKTVSKEVQPGDLGSRNYDSQL